MGLTIVTGLPRSGTSLVTGVIRACGAWTGPTTGPSEWNRKGNVENGGIREHIIKPYLTRIPACPLGLRSLPVPGIKPHRSAAWLRSAVMTTFRRQGWKGGPIVIKDAKIALMWPLWAAAFPHAKWVIVHRDREQVIDSVMRAEPMMRHFADRRAVTAWADEYTRRVNQISVRSGCVAVRVHRTIELRPLIGWLGLEWNESAVNEWVDPELLTSA